MILASKIWISHFHVSCWWGNWSTYSQAVLLLDVLVGVCSWRCKVMRLDTEAAAWMNQASGGHQSQGAGWSWTKHGVWWLTDRSRQGEERRGGRAEGLYLPAASPHRNSCLSECNRCRFTEGGSRVWQLPLVLPLLLFSCWIKHKSCCEKTFISTSSSYEASPNQPSNFCSL